MATTADTIRLCQISRPGIISVFQNQVFLFVHLGPPLSLISLKCLVGLTM